MKSPLKWIISTATTYTKFKIPDWEEARTQRSSDEQDIRVLWASQLSKTYILYKNISSCTYNGMRTGELWLLAIFVSQYITSVLPSQLFQIKWAEQNIPNIVQQLHIALLRVYTESLDKSITHRARRFTRFVCISARLWIFASTPHNLRKRSSPTSSLTPEEGENLRHLQG